jgi:hypothetical protein
MGIPQGKRQSGGGQDKKGRIGFFLFAFVRLALGSFKPADAPHICGS